MTLVAYVLLIAAGVVLWGLVSSWLPRFGFLANGAALLYVILTPPLSVVGFGWTVLVLLTVGFGLVAAIGGLIEQRQRAAATTRLPHARLRN